jgi:hypothetical protein
MVCNIKRIKPTKLCTGDLKFLVAIQTITLEGSDFGSSEPSLAFLTVRSQWCAIETVEGVSRFAKINIEDGATHLFWCEWDSSFPDIEKNNHFILHDLKRYTVLRVNNINERNETLVIQTTERGKATEEATEA